ncbi:hypothetical protein FD755_011378 [Muntiacus reevesi]|uniref:Uncharacterized protein n=1 Tax=Muntiacus reevesi TaxID=9886 RepID=A0A5N3XWE4_MUNRE|nr:hypothetical protein FD755_011378 [Muntiacus reevesi]
MRKPPPGLSTTVLMDLRTELKPLGHSHYQHCDANDEELDKVLDVDGGTLGQPRSALDHKVVDHEVQNQDENCDCRHDQTCPGNKSREPRLEGIPRALSRDGYLSRHTPRP